MRSGLFSPEVLRRLQADIGERTGASMRSGLFSPEVPLRAVYCHANSLGLLQ